MTNMKVYQVYELHHKKKLKPAVYQFV